MTTFALFPDLDCPEPEGIKDESIAFIEHIAQIIPALHRSGMTDKQLNLIFQTLADAFRDKDN